MTDRYDHLCAEPKCCSYKQRTFARCCACHKTRETMMLERIAELETAIEIYTGAAERRIHAARALVLTEDGGEVDPIMQAAE